MTCLEKQHNYPWHHCFERQSMYNEYYKFFGIDKYNLTRISESNSAYIYSTLRSFLLKKWNHLSSNRSPIIVLPIHQFAINYILFYSIQVYIATEEK